MDKALVLSKRLRKYWASSPLILSCNEDERFAEGTKSLMTYLNKQSIVTILAGGDIVACAKKLGAKFTFVSTGGGATLEYLEGKRFKTLERLQG